MDLLGLRFSFDISSILLVFMVNPNLPGDAIMFASYLLKLPLQIIEKQARWRVFLEVLCGYPATSAALRLDFCPFAILTDGNHQ